MTGPITLDTVQEHTRDIQIATGHTWYETPGVDFDAKVADIRRGIAAYAEEQA